MVGLDEDCLLAVVNKKNEVIGSVSLSEYKKDPKGYKIICIRVLPISEDKEFVLSSDVFFEGSAYDTKYTTILKYKEEYETALKRVEDILPSSEKFFLMQYSNIDEKYDINVFLYYTRQNVKEAKKNEEDIICYPSDIGTDDIIENNMLFSEIGFVKTNIIPYLDLDISRIKDL